MSPKLFIPKEFYFLILESNVGPHHKYSSKWVIKFKNQRDKNKWIVKKNVLHNNNNNNNNNNRHFTFYT